MSNLEYALSYAIEECERCEVRCQALEAENAKLRAVAEAANIHIRKGGMANAQRLSDALAALEAKP